MTLIQQQQRWDFLESEFLTSSINAALQHSSTYATKKETERGIVRRELRLGLCKLARKYVNQVNEKNHLRNIQRLINRVEKSCAPFLKNSHLRFGVAQKALNLYLKYLWCEGEVKAPPHCPFDYSIIQQLGFRDKWTRVKDKAIYLKWVRKGEKARDAENYESLAEWELHAWSAAQPGGKAGCPPRSQARFSKVVPD
jgi:hypothetical protein